MKTIVKEIITGGIVGIAILGFMVFSLWAYNADFRVDAAENIDIDSLDLMKLLDRYVEEEDMGYAVYEEVPIDFEGQVAINSIANNYGVPISLVWAIAKKESQFNSDAVGDEGDSIGMMQIQTKWHQERMEDLGVEKADLVDPVENALVAIDYLAELYSQKACWPWVIMAYNEGAERANEKWEKETYRTLYSLEVLSYMNDFTR